VKLLHDNFPNLKFFLSGSGSILLEREASNNLAGRYFLTPIELLSLKEFFEMRAGRKLERKELGVWEGEIAMHLDQFIKKPFPEEVGWEHELKLREYIRESVVEKIVRKDIPQMFKGINEEALILMLEIFYQDPGMCINLDSLARSLRMSKKNLLKHLFYLSSPI